MLPPPPAWAALLVAALFGACSGMSAQGTPARDGGPTGDTDPSGEAALRVALTDEMNYRFEGSLTAATTPVRANGDLSFDWSTVTVDMLGRTLDPLADVDMMQLMLWRYDKDTFLAGINQESLDTGRLMGMGYCDAGHVRTGCRLFDLVAPAGTPIPETKLLEYVDPATYSPADHVWVVMLATGTVFGRGTRLLAFFQPGVGETNDQVHLTNASTTMSYTVDLGQLVPISLPPRTGNVVLGWADTSLLTKNAMGAAWVPTRITEVAVAHYVGYTLGELERQSLLLRDLASEYYEVRLSAGQEVVLHRLTDQAGSSFSGIDENGIWLFSLICGGCRNPAPWFLSVLRPGP